MIRRLLGSNGQYSRYPLGHFLHTMQALGLHRLDFVPQTPHFFLSHTHHENPQTLRAMLADAGLAVAVLSPLPYRYAITASENDQRNATEAYYRNAIGLAAVLGARQVVLGASGACWDIPPEALWANARSMLASLCEEAGHAGITLLLSPVMGKGTPLIAESPILGTAEALATMIREVDHPAIGAMLDTNVMSACGESIAQWHALLGTHLQLVRLSDGNYHGWRAWGEGCLPMARYREALDACGYQGDFSLHLPGERYIDCPAHPDRAALQALGCGGAYA